MYARSRSAVVVAIVVLVAACSIDDGALESTAAPQSTTEVVGNGTTTTSEAIPSSKAATTTTTTTTIPAALAFPRTYVGGGSSTWSLSWSDGGCLVEGNTLELTLKADRTLSGSYRRIEPTFSGNTAPGATRASVECAEQIFPYDPVEVTGSHTPPDPGTSGAGTVVVEIVGWPDWHIEGEYTPSEMMFEWEIDLVATGYEGDEPDPRITRAVDYQLLFADEG